MNIALNLLGMSPEQGGMYQYAVTFTRNLLASDPVNTYVLFYDYEGLLEQNSFNLARTTPVKVSSRLQLGLTPFGWKALIPRGSLAQRILRRLVRTVPSRATLFQGDYSIFKDHGARLLIQPSHVSADALLSGLPYLIAIHDSPYQWNEAHRKTRSPRFLAWYESLIRQLARHAMTVLVDSPNGRDAMVRGYGVASDRVRILPFRPPDYITGVTDPERAKRVAEKFGLPESFLFYPSKFHAHKNHLGLIDALTIVRSRHGVAVPLVLVGSTSNDDTYARVMARIESAGLGEQVRCLGYVPDEDMAALYTRALALIFPTFMGPTAIPILEAFAFGCPVICADVEGFPDQVGDAGLLVDPESPEDMAAAIHAVASNAALRQDLSEKGRHRFRELTAGDYGKEVHAIVQDLVARVESAEQRQ